MQEVQTTLPIGSIVQGRYRVEDLLGKGGFGAVYLVRDQRVKGNVYALKEVIEPDREERERFAFECEVLKRLDHSALTRVYREFEDEQHSRVYMLMDYVEGSNLEHLRLLQPEKRFPIAQVIQFMGPIVDAIGYLHHQKPPIIHRDIKPANIILPSSGKDAVLVDFGIAKEYDQEGTTTAVRRCSPGYGAPEQYARGTNTRTDIYGLAATIYALVTGVVPMDALYRMTQMGSKNLDPLEPAKQLAPALPQHISDALQRAMSINSNDRFATIEEFWQAITSAPLEDDEDTQKRVAVVPGRDRAAAQAATTPVVSSQVASGAAAMPGRKRRRGALVLLFAAIAILAMVAGVLAFSHGLPGQRGSGITGGNPTHPTTAPTSKATAGVTPTPAATSTPVSTPTTAPTTTPTPRPTQAPAGYPSLAPTYSGTIVDQQYQPGVQSSMTLTNIQQNQGTIGGYFSVGSELQGSGNFSGTVTKDNKVMFLVNGSNGNAPLLFSGTIQTDGSMSGNYCSSINNQCDYNAGGFGTWKVNPPQAPSSGSHSSLPLEGTDGNKLLKSFLML